MWGGKKNRCDKMQSNHKPPTSHNPHKPGEVIVFQSEMCHMTHTREGIT